jgi:hypothetical protein
VVAAVYQRHPCRPSRHPAHRRPKPGAGSREAAGATFQSHPALLEAGHLPPLLPFRIAAPAPVPCRQRSSARSATRRADGWPWPAHSTITPVSVSGATRRHRDGRHGPGAMPARLRLSGGYRPLQKPAKPTPAAADLDSGRRSQHPTRGPRKADRPGVPSRSGTLSCCRT